MAHVNLVGLQLVRREITVKKVKFLFKYKNYAPIRISKGKHSSHNISLTIQNSLLCTIYYIEKSHENWNILFYFISSVLYFRQSILVFIRYLYEKKESVFWKKLVHLIYIYFVPDIGLAVRVFANSPGDLGSIPDQVIPKTQKMVLDASSLNTQHYKVRIKGKVEQPPERSSALPYTLV